MQLGKTRSGLVAVIALAFVLAAGLCMIVPAGTAEAATSSTRTTVKIGAKAYTMKLASGEAAQAFRAYLIKSRTFKMSELNGNEKYRYFSSKTFPANERRYKKVKAGDVMLYGDDCLVIFYKTYKTSYKYTKIGRLTSTKGLAKAVGKKSVKVRFGKMKQSKKGAAATKSSLPGEPSGSAAVSTGKSAVSDELGKTENSSSEDPVEPGATANPSSSDDNSEKALILRIGSKELRATLADSVAARELRAKLENGPATVSLHPYGGFEAVGSLPWSLPTSDVSTTTSVGNVMLYNGNQITVFYGSNSWTYTPLGKIEGATRQSLLEVLGDGNVTMELSIG